MSNNKVVPTDKARLAVLTAISARTGGNVMARPAPKTPAPTAAPQ